MLRLAVVSLLACLAATAQAETAEGARLNAWLDRVWEETLVRNPIQATFLGDPRYNAELPNFTTAAWRADDRAFRQRQLAELKRFSRKKLSGSDRVSYDLLKSDLE